MVYGDKRMQLNCCWWRGVGGEVFWISFTGPRGSKLCNDQEYENKDTAVCSWISTL